jgi:hypothetical protein
MRSTVRSTFFLTGYGKTCVKENHGVRAIGLDDVRFIDALTTSVVLCTLDRRVWVLRRNCCLNLCCCIATEHLFGGTVHVTIIWSARKAWRLRSSVRLSALLRLSRWSRGSGVVRSCCETCGGDNRPRDDTGRDQPDLLEAAESR